jgi:ATP-dependent Lhr-like helicase
MKSTTTGSKGEDHTEESLKLDPVFSMFSKQLLQKMRESNIISPTEIQRLGIPTVFSSNDVLLVAPTGTGKTEAAMLPILEFLIRRSQEGIHLSGIEVLYITPLRALNRDIFRRLKNIAESLCINIEVRHGDTPKKTRRKQAIKPPNILITTPETLQAILSGRLMRGHLRNVQWVVIDEIHELVNDKRGIQLSIALERLAEITTKEFQRIGLSATVGRTKEETLALSGNRSPMREIRSSHFKKFDIIVESPTTEDSDREFAKRLLLSSSNIGRARRICELIKEYNSVLVFTNTREHAEALASRIRLLNPTLKIGVHHGSLSKEVRIEVEKQFNAKQLDAIICTSSLELGIDIGEVDYVIQYMSPRQVVKITQRIGRSGHSAEATAKGCIIGLSSDDILEGAVIVARAISGEIETLKLHSKALDVLSHQVVGIVLEKGAASTRNILEIVSRAYPYRNLSEKDLVDTILQLHSERVIRFDGEFVRRGSRLFEYYYENLSMIPDVSRYEVYDFVRKRRIANLDQDFVGKYGQSGNEIIIRGHAWRILSVDDDRKAVDVEPIEQTLAAIPTWEGEMMPVSFEVAWEVGRLRGEIAEAKDEDIKLQGILERYRMTPTALDRVVQTIRKQASEGYPVPTSNLILIEGGRNYVVVHSCFGNHVNETLSRVLASILSSRFGSNVGVRSDPYRIVLFATFSLRAEHVKRELMDLSSDDIEQILTESSYNTSLFTWRLWHVARRFGAIRKDVEYSYRKARMMSRILRDNPIGRETLREIRVEKYDAEKLKELLSYLRNGTIKVIIREKKGDFSPLASTILDRIIPQDLLRPAVPVKALVDLTKERLNAKRVRLVCVYRGDWQGVRTIRSLPERIKCPKCDSSLVAATYQDDDQLMKIVKKKLRKKRVTEKEEKEWLKGWKNASLVQDNGKKAVVALAGRGIGPTTAIRIFRRYRKSEDDFYLNILKAERDYTRTRMFWD